MLDHGTLDTGHIDPQEALRHRLRHSAAHVMADAVLKLFPEAKMGIGPPIHDGFYYDFDVSRPFTPEDLEEIEKLMGQTIAAGHQFHREEIGREEAKTLFSGQPYKLEIIDDLSEETTLSIFRHNEFVDLCQGPHVENTADISAVKLMNVAGAYWRGDEHRPMLQRIYGTAFESQQALDDHLARLEEAERRDHRILGRQLGLFSIHDEIGPGLIVWHPKGGLVRTIIENYWRDLHYRRGYDILYSPHIGRAQLWQTSGHLDFYRESMYAPLEIDDQEYFLKPMNCPFHIMVYRSSLRSYRELPLRFAELGTVYRYERSGVLHGLMRVRGFTQDDAHIFCRPDQVEDEIGGVLDLTFELLEAFGFTDYSIMLSTRPEKYVGEPEMWDHATQSLRQSLEARNLSFDMDEGGGAFYGPKIDIKIKDALGRAWQCTTVQFDFNLPERFDLVYQDSEGGRSRPYMVHRAILGSMERFMGVLIEHYAGAFPLWLAPVQAVVIPIADRHNEYAEQVKDALAAGGFRAEVDSRSERMNLKIRNAQMQKVPYMLVVGDKEMEAQSVSVRHREEGDLGAMALDALLAKLKGELGER
ncbi:MAG: threonine--tRNA ligase [Chloroflexi bacterium]|nr:threonine--tRNA ligase [Chloroflexota bacterium]MCI0785558.1 threonine--tRNA ligase [Chloroflexota bacterium]MCI0792251.1 threonine--tRNA ligase [Chloroflexota bacterium]